MNLSQYLHMLSASSTNPYRCAYCGNMVHALSNGSFCNYCEMPRKEIETIPKEQHDLLSAKIEFLGEYKYEKASKKVDEIAQKYPSPGVLYASAIFYSEYSNYMFRGVDYNGKGYMYENSQKREQSWILHAKSRGLMHSCIKMCNDELKSGYTDFTAYVKLLSSARIKDIVAANEAFSMLSKSDAKGQIQIYSAMVYYTLVKNRKEASINISAMANSDINFAYYASEIYIYGKDNASAKKILSSFLNNSKMPHASELLAKVDDAMEASKV